MSKDNEQQTTGPKERKYGPDSDYDETEVNAWIDAFNNPVEDIHLDHKGPNDNDLIEPAEEKPDETVGT